MELLARAAELGLETGFFDGQGRRHQINPAALEILVDAMPVRPSERLLEQPVIIRAGRTSRAGFAASAALPVDWRIVGEGGVLATGQAGERDVVWPDNLPPGVHRLHLTDAAGRQDEQAVVVAPAQAFQGDFDRCWLLAVQLYGISSQRNWGIGDFSDLAGLIELAAQLGADGIGLNPLHALFSERPADCSPYSPNSRLFLNPLYIDIERIPEFSFDLVDINRDELDRLRHADLVDYVAVADLKWRALRAAYDRFRYDPEGERHAAFEHFRAGRGRLLSRFACFEVLRRKFARPWWEWPAPWQAPDDAQCEALRTGDDAVEITFVEFVQWIADVQLGACRERAAALGMKVGLYVDVAVGVQADGFDAWNEQHAISRRLAVGAPPDPLNTAGQNWGLAGFNAAGLEAESFRPFRDMLQASMRHAGAIRLDHVLGLNRLYLIPHGFSPRDGAYVPMPFEALLAIVAEESVAARCVVIGEDLGTVPEGFRDRIADWGIWSYRVMMFERDPQGGFCGVEHYAPNALVTFSTHDLATFAGWRGADDLRLKHSLGMDPGESDEARRHAINMLSAALRHHAIERDDFLAVVKFLSDTRSRLLAIALEDVLGIVDQPNVPGTIDEHPNWRRRLPVMVSDIAESIDRGELAHALGNRRSRSPP